MPSSVAEIQRLLKRQDPSGKGGEAMPHEAMSPDLLCLPEGNDDHPKPDLGLPLILPVEVVPRKKLPPDLDAVEEDVKASESSMPDDGREPPPRPRDLPPSSMSPEGKKSKPLHWTKITEHPLSRTLPATKSPPNVPPSDVPSPLRPSRGGKRPHEQKKPGVVIKPAKNLPKGKQPKKQPKRTKSKEVGLELKTRIPSLAVYDLCLMSHFNERTAQQNQLYLELRGKEIVYKYLSGTEIKTEGRKPIWKEASITKKEWAVYSKGEPFPKEIDDGWLKKNNKIVSEITSYRGHTKGCYYYMEDDWRQRDRQEKLNNAYAEEKKPYIKEHHPDETTDFSVVNFSFHGTWSEIGDESRITAMAAAIHPEQASYEMRGPNARGTDVNEIVDIAVNQAIQCIEAEILAGRFHQDPNFILRFNLRGFSRGAVNCLRFEKRLGRWLKKNYPELFDLRRVRVNIFANEPVAGLTDKSDPEAGYVSPLVERVHFKYACGEERIIMNAQGRERLYIQYPMYFHHLTLGTEIPSLKARRKMASGIYLYRVGSSSEIHAVIVYADQDSEELNLSKLAAENKEISDVLAELPWGEKDQKKQGFYRHEKLKRFITANCMRPQTEETVDFYPGAHSDGELHCFSREHAVCQRFLILRDLEISEQCGTRFGYDLNLIDNFEEKASSKNVLFFGYSMTEGLSYMYFGQEGWKKHVIPAGKITCNIPVNGIITKEWLEQNKEILFKYTSNEGHPPRFQPLMLTFKADKPIAAVAEIKGLCEKYIQRCKEEKRDEYTLNLVSKIGMLSQDKIKKMDRGIYLYRAGDPQEFHAKIVHDEKYSEELNLSKLAAENKEISDVLASLPWGKKKQGSYRFPKKLVEFITSKYERIQPRDMMVANDTIQTCEKILDFLSEKDGAVIDQRIIKLLKSQCAAIKDFISIKARLLGEHGIGQWEAAFDDGYRLAKSPLGRFVFTKPYERPSSDEERLKLFLDLKEMKDRYDKQAKGRWGFWNNTRGNTVLYELGHQGGGYRRWSRAFMTPAEEDSFQAICPEIFWRLPQLESDYPTYDEKQVPWMSRFMKPLKRVVQFCMKPLEWCGIMKPAEQEQLYQPQQEDILFPQVYGELQRLETISPKYYLSFAKYLSKRMGGTGEEDVESEEGMTRLAKRLAQKFPVDRVDPPSYDELDLDHRLRRKCVEEAQGSVKKRRELRATARCLQALLPFFEKIGEVPPYAVTLGETLKEWRGILSRDPRIAAMGCDIRDPMTGESLVKSYKNLSIQG